MKKLLFSLIPVIILMMSACAPGGGKIDQASTGIDNLQCSFALDTPVGYDFTYGVGFSGVVYKDGRPITRTLWVPQAIYEKVTSNQDIQTLKIYKGKCFHCRGASRPTFADNAYLVYFIE